MDLAQWETLPKNITHTIASYLSLSCAANFSCTCKKWNLLQTTGSVQLLDNFSVASVILGKVKSYVICDVGKRCCELQLRQSTGKVPFFEVPVTNFTTVHSITITAFWADVRRTGWKGIFFVTKDNTVAPFDIECCVVQCETRETNFKYQTVELTFNPKPKHLYTLWYEVLNRPNREDEDEEMPGNFDDELAVNEILVEAEARGEANLSTSIDLRYHILDDDRLHFKRGFNFLLRSKSLRPWDRMMPPSVSPCDCVQSYLKKLEEAHKDTVLGFVDSAGELIKEKKQLPTPMANFYKSFGIKAALLTKDMLDLLSNILHEWEREGLHFNGDTSDGMSESEESDHDTSESEESEHD